MGVDISPVEDDMERLATLGQTPIVLSCDGQIVGLIGIADDPREDAAPTLRALKQLGIERLVMLSGDRELTAGAAASKLALTDVYAELLPEDKFTRIKTFGSSAGPAAMVGDGINDAPALAAADVGIAMGAGTDAAFEAADVALTSNHLCQLPDLISLGRSVVTTVRFNTILALASKAIVVAIAAAGYSSLSVAILADVGATLAVTFISLGLLRRRWLDKHDPEFHPLALQARAAPVR